MKADIVIVGAGMVGSLLAAALKPLNLQIVLIDHAPVTQPPAPDAPFEPRVSAITRASENMLRQVGAWDLLAQQRYAPFSSMHVWEQEGRAELEFFARDTGAGHLGCLVENRLLQWALTTVALADGAVWFFAPDKLTALERYPQYWRVSLASGKQIDTPLVIGADGALSAVRQFAAIGMETWDYRQHAIVCTVQTEKPHGDCARQVFLKTGPLAFLPLSKPDHCSIVWSAGDDRAQVLMAMPEDQFRQELERALSGVLGQVIWSDRRHAFPLIARHAERYHLDGLALVGDAAHTIHPLAGQGVNLGFLDAAVLAEEITRGVARGLSPEHSHILSKYSRRRRSHNALMMHSMTALERIYAASLPAVIQGRNEGVRLVNSTGWLKTFFEQQAMGLSGDLPVLAC
jgi:2-octaprenylphenol hydroxylase